MSDRHFPPHPSGRYEQLDPEELEGIDFDEIYQRVADLYGIEQLRRKTPEEVAAEEAEREAEEEP